MTTLREAAQQALEALENASDIMDSWAQQRQDDAITALRAALAEPTGKDHLQVEPVAWMDVDDRGNMLSLRFWSEGGHEEVPLYLHPAPQRQPLSGHEIRRIVDETVKLATPHEHVVFHEVVRAVERAHGIGGQDEQV